MHCEETALRQVTFQQITKTTQYMRYNNKQTIQIVADRQRLRTQTTCTVTRLSYYTPHQLIMFSRYSNSTSGSIHPCYTIHNSYNNSHTQTYSILLAIFYLRALLTTHTDQYPKVWRPYDSLQWHPRWSSLPADFNGCLQQSRLLAFCYGLSRLWSPVDFNSCFLQFPLPSSFCYRLLLLLLLLRDQSARGRSSRLLPLNLFRRLASQWMEYAFIIQSTASSNLLPKLTTLTRKTLHSRIHALHVKYMNHNFP
jgi:hypothetical protein